MKRLSNVLLAVDLEHDSTYLQQLALFLHGKFNSGLHLLHVLPQEVQSSTYGDIISNNARDVLQKLKKYLLSKGVEQVDIMIAYGSIFDRIIYKAEEVQANVILMGPGVRDSSDSVKIGTTVEKVIRKTDVPVWVVKSGFTNIRKIACSVDFSESSSRALENAIRLAQVFSAELHVLSVFEAHNTYSRWISNLDELNEQAYKEFGEKFKDFLDGFSFGDIRWRRKIMQGAPAKKVLSYLQKEKLDLLLMGTTGRTGLAKILMGSVTEKVIRELPCSFITTKSRNVINTHLEFQVKELKFHFEKGKQLIDVNEEQEALAYLLHAYDIDNMHVPTLLLLSVACKKLGDKKNAQKYLQMAKGILDRLWPKEIARQIESFYTA